MHILHYICFTNKITWAHGCNLEEVDTVQNAHLTIMWWGKGWDGGIAFDHIFGVSIRQASGLYTVRTQWESGQEWSLTVRADQTLHFLYHWGDSKLVYLPGGGGDGLLGREGHLPRLIFALDIFMFTCLVRQMCVTQKHNEADYARTYMGSSVLLVEMSQRNVHDGATA